MDLINKKDAIDIIEKYFNKIALNPDICTDGLRSLPTVDAIPIEWIEQYVKSKTYLLGDAELWMKWMIEDWEKQNGSY